MAYKRAGRVIPGCGVGRHATMTEAAQGASCAAQMHASSDSEKSTQRLKVDDQVDQQSPPVVAISAVAVGGPHNHLA